jgi:hypothetical protein
LDVSFFTGPNRFPNIAERPQKGVEVCPALSQRRADCFTREDAMLDGIAAGVNVTGRVLRLEEETVSYTKWVGLQAVEHLIEGLSKGLEIPDQQ